MSPTEVDHHSDITAAVNSVLGFVEGMNNWQTRMYYRSRIESEKFVPEKWTVLAKDSYEKVLNEYYDVLSEFCTKRERKYGGSPLSWTKNGAYNGIARNTITEARTIGIDRIEIVAKGGAIPNEEYKFVVLKRQGKWLVDNLLSRVAPSRNWLRAYV